MQTMLAESRDDRGLLSRGWGMVFGNLRYIIWFWLLNLVLAALGTAAFSYHASGILDHSLYSSRLVRGFDVPVLIEMLARPEFGPMEASSKPATNLVAIFVLATILFLPGVFQGYATNYRLPRDEFFRACGRNLWRFIRLLLMAGVVMGIVAGLLFALHHWLVEKASDSTNEMLPFEVKVITLAIIFLVMTGFRIWFDLAEIDVVLSDRNAVRRSIASGFRHTLRHLGKLLGSYVLITIVAAIVLAAGLWSWMALVAPESVVGAFVIGQLTLLLLLIPRFWQRGVAVAYWQGNMVAPVVAAPVTAPAPVLESPVTETPVAPAESAAPGVPLPTETPEG